MPAHEPRILPWELLAGSVLDLLFPPRCLVCGRVDSWLCAECTSRLPWITGPVCARCGLPLEHAGLCARCRKEPLRLSMIRSLMLFEDPLRAAIHRLKYRHGWQMARPLGALMAEYWQAHPLPADVVVPVPLHPARFLRRGYNQSALLAGELGRRVGLPLDESALQRVRATATQMRLKAAERRRNVAGAFRCADGRLRGRNVLLVDDVCTTGATLEACADALREAGAGDVWALTLARAP